MSDAKGRSRRGGTGRLSEDGSAPEEGEARRTERLDPTGEEWSAQEPVNPGWRRERAAGRPARRGRGALPASPQEFQLWLQAGGWRYLAGIAVLLVVLLIAILAFSRGDQREAGLNFADEPTALPVSGAGNDPLLLPSSTPLAQPSPAPAPPPAGGQFFVVTGTGSDGLNLRADHNAQAAILSFYLDGTALEQIGEDFVGPDRVWRNVRAPDGQEGWVAVDFLQPAP